MSENKSDQVTDPTPDEVLAETLIEALWEDNKGVIGDSIEVIEKNDFEGIMRPIFDRIIHHGILKDVIAEVLVS